MNKPKIWLSSPHLGGAEQQFVSKAIATNWVAPLGPNVDGFEQDLQNYTGVGHVAALSSGTAALHLALRLIGLKPGQYVLVQSFTFCGSANPVTYDGGIPVFIDSELDTWNMCPKALEEAIVQLNEKGKEIAAIMPVHLYGMPAKMDEISAIAAKYSIPIIEDSAESLGSFYKNKHTGSFSAMTAFSFNGNKIITTSGGGALASNDEGLIQKSRFLATQARDSAPHYEHTEIGFNYRMSNILAGIGRGQMLVLDKHIKLRRANYTRYREYFEQWNQKGFQIKFQEEADGNYSNRWLTCILVEPKTNKGLTREKIRLALETDNIESRPLWKPMHLQPVFEGYPFFGDGTSEKLFDMGLCLPSGSNLSDEDFERIFAVLDKVFD